jgi:hypothetical protein
MAVSTESMGASSDVTDTTPDDAGAVQRGQFPQARRSPLHWSRVLGVGLALWIVSIVLLILTQSLTLLPTVILLGSFLVPVTAVVFHFEHDLSPTLEPRSVMYAFLLGGVRRQNLGRAQAARS